MFRNCSCRGSAAECGCDLCGWVEPWQILAGLGALKRDPLLEPLEANVSCQRYLHQSRCKRISETQDQQRHTSNTHNENAQKESLHVETVRSQVCMYQDYLEIHQKLRSVYSAQYCQQLCLSLRAALARPRSELWMLPEVHLEEVLICLTSYGILVMKHWKRAKSCALSCLLALLGYCLTSLAFRSNNPQCFQQTLPTQLT